MADFQSKMKIKISHDVSVFVTCVSYIICLCRPCRKSCGMWLPLYISSRVIWLQQQQNKWVHWDCLSPLPGGSLSRDYSPQQCHNPSFGSLPLPWPLQVMIGVSNRRSSVTSGHSTYFDVNRPTWDLVSSLPLICWMILNKLLNLP